MRVKDIVSKNPKVHSGDLVFAGTRVPVDTLVDYLKGGHSLDRFIRGFPTVHRRQAEAFLELGMDQIKTLIEEQQAKEQRAGERQANEQQASKEPEAAHARAH